MDQPKYRIEIFWSDEDGGYIANVPDLRYCSAFGESYEEALREVLVAMELHLDTLKKLGREIPEPKSHRVVRVLDIGSEQGHVVEQIVEAEEGYVLEYDTDAVGQVADRVAGLADQAGETAVSATEQARRVAEELGIDLSQVEGTGAGGLITVRDVTRTAP
jgi:predicted RNase H-like HicB family nuclease